MKIFVALVLILLILKLRIIHRPEEGQKIKKGLYVAQVWYLICIGVEDSLNVFHLRSWFFMFGYCQL